MNRHTGLILVLLAFAPAAFGQTIIYRSTMPDGRTVLSDRPTPGAKKVEEFYTPKSPPPPPAPVAPPAAAAKTDPTAKPAAESRSAKLDAAIKELREAEEELRQLEAERAEGQAPKEGDRQGTSSGKSRLNENYFNRQKELDQNVDEAEQRIDELRARVKSLRY
ncbi:MAG: DUF4124 domain-containing protein [Betaproteobacteria bacterium]|nr:DUF4124 domain-containing protein [Betaproteobacteria bacterium]